MARRVQDQDQEATDQSEGEVRHNERVIRNERLVNSFQASLDTSSGSSVNLRVIPVNERVPSVEESTDSWRIDHRARFYRDSAAILNINIPSSIQETEAPSASSLGSPSAAGSSRSSQYLDNRITIEIRVEAPNATPKGVTVRVAQPDTHRVRIYSDEESCNQTLEADTTEEEVVRICAKRELAWKFEIEILQPCEQEEGSNKRQRLDR